MPLVGTDVPEFSHVGFVVNSRGGTDVLESAAWMVDANHVAYSAWLNGAQTTNIVLENPDASVSENGTVGVGISWSKLNKCLANAGIGWAVATLIAATCGVACATAVLCLPCAVFILGYTSGGSQPASVRHSPDMWSCSVLWGKAGWPSWMVSGRPSRRLSATARFMLLVTRNQ